MNQKSIVQKETNQNLTSLPTEVRVFNVLHTKIKIEKLKTFKIIFIETPFNFPGLCLPTRRFQLFFVVLKL